MQEKFKRLFDYEFFNMVGEAILSQEEYEQTFEALMDIAEDYAVGNKRFRDLLETWGATDGWLGHIPEIIGILNTLGLLE